MDPEKRNMIGVRFSSNQQERILEAYEENQIRDISPSKISDFSTYEKILNLRQRETYKEIGPPSFRYRSNHHKPDRVVATIINRKAKGKE